MVAGMVARANSINDMDLLRRMGRLFSGVGRRRRWVSSSGCQIGRHCAFHDHYLWLVITARR
jgi:hypothetical protein